MFVLKLYIILIFVDALCTLYLMYYFNEQQIKFPLEEKYDKLFKDSFLYGVCIVPCFLTIVLVTSLCIIS